MCHTGSFECKTQKIMYRLKWRTVYPLTRIGVWVSEYVYECMCVWLVISKHCNQQVNALRSGLHRASVCIGTHYQRKCGMRLQRMEIDFVDIKRNLIAHVYVDEMISLHAEHLVDNHRPVYIYIYIYIYIYVCCGSFRCSGTGKWFSNRKETSCLPHIHIHTYMHACTRTCVRAGVCMSACVRACMHTYIHTYIQL